MSAESKTQPLKKESAFKGKMASFGMALVTTQTMYIVYKKGTINREFS